MYTVGYIRVMGAQRQCNAHVFSFVLSLRCCVGVAGGMSWSIASGQRITTNRLYCTTTTNKLPNHPPSCFGRYDFETTLTIKIHKMVIKMLRFSPFIVDFDDCFVVIKSTW